MLVHQLTILSRVLHTRDCKPDVNQISDKIKHSIARLKWRTLANVGARERTSNFRTNFVSFERKRRRDACWLWGRREEVPPEDKRGGRGNFRRKMFGSWQDRPAFNRFSYLRKPKRSDSDGWNRSLVSEQHTIRFYGPSLIAETSRANRTEWIDIVQPTDMNSLLNLKYWKFIYFV